MLEEEDKLKTSENISETLEKLVRKINIDSYKKLSEQLKAEMSD
jgi:hypothetical protein